MIAITRLFEQIELSGWKCIMIGLLLIVLHRTSLEIL